MLNQNLCSLVMGGIAMGSLCLAAPAIAQDAGQSHLGIPLDKVGVVSFTIRAQLAEDPRGTLEAVAACGIKNIEFSSPNLSADVPSFAGVEVDQIKAFSEEFGFAVPSLGVNAADLDERMDVVIDAAKTLGASYVRISGGFDIEGEEPEQYYVRLAQLLNEAGATLKAEDITLLYHNHDREFRYVGGGRSGYDVLLEEVDPANADFELDLYWTVVGNSNPIKLIENNPDRFKLYHIKDAHEIGVGRGMQTTMTTMGAGFIDFAEIFELDEQAGVQYYFIENDNPLPDGVTSTCDGYAYIAAATTEEADSLISASQSMAANAAQQAELEAAAAAATPTR